MSSASQQQNSGRQVALPTRIGFGVGDFGFVLVWQGTTLFLMYFYTDVLGISPFIAGAIYLAAMIWDAVTDPVIATMAERSQTRWGKYRPWIFAGAIPFGLSYMLAFSTAPAVWLAPWFWALSTHIILRTAYTVVSMPFNAMQARLTTDSDERTTLSGFRMIGAAMGGLSVVVLTPFLVAAFGNGDEAAGYFWAACVAGSLATLGLFYCSITMREPDDAPEPTTTSSFLRDLAKGYGLISQNGQLMRVFGIIVVGTICLGMFSKNVLYHFKYDVDRPDLVTPALLLPALLLILATPFWVWLSKRTSKRNTLLIGLGIALLGYVGFFLNPSNLIPTSFIAIGMIGLGTSALPVMFWSMLPDTIDYGQSISGERVEARTFGIATFAQKAAVGINALILGGLLSVIGFEANTVQSDDTLTAMKAIMALIPALGTLLIFWFLRGYRLDRTTHRAIQTSLGQ